MMKSTVIHARVSAGPFQTLDAQVAYLNAHLPKGLENVAWTLEEKSASKGQTPQFKSLLGAVMRGDVARIYTYKIDRLARRASDVLLLCQECEKRGVDIVGLADGARLLTHNGKFLIGMLALLAEREIDELSGRTKMGMAEAKAKGKVIG